MLGTEKFHPLVLHDYQTTGLDPYYYQNYIVDKVIEQSRPLYADRNRLHLCDDTILYPANAGIFE